MKIGSLLQTFIDICLHVHICVFLNDITISMNEKCIHRAYHLYFCIFRRVLLTCKLVFDFRSIQNHFYSLTIVSRNFSQRKKNHLSLYRFHRIFSKELLEFSHNFLNSGYSINFTPFINFTPQFFVLFCSESRIVIII